MSKKVVGELIPGGGSVIWGSATNWREDYQRLVEQETDTSADDDDAKGRDVKRRRLYDGYP